MKNVGKAQYRFKSNPEERAFAEAWEAINTRDHGIVNYLLSDDPNRPRCVTQEERTIAATVIQWLGSPVGQGFLGGLGWEKRKP